MYRLIHESDRLSPSGCQKKLLQASGAAEEEFISLHLQSVIRGRLPVSPQDQNQTFTLLQPMRCLHGDPNQDTVQWEGTAFLQLRCEGGEGGGEAEMEEVQRDEEAVPVGRFQPPSSEAQEQSQRAQ